MMFIHMLVPEVVKGPNNWMMVPAGDSSRAKKEFRLPVHVLVPSWMFTWRSTMPLAPNGMGRPLTLMFRVNPVYAFAEFHVSHGACVVFEKVCPAQVDAARVAIKVSACFIWCVAGVSTLGLFHIPVLI